MKKKLLAFLLILLLVALTTQVVFAIPPWEDPDDASIGACNMFIHWSDPGNANGVQPGERGMWNVHYGTNPHHGQQGPEEEWYTNGAANMDALAFLHCPELLGE